jgi:carbon storage regulator CsrA
MLVIGRQIGESVRIGEAVVTIQRHGRGGVRLAIDAPPHVPVVRCELERPGPSKVQRPTSNVDRPSGQSDL